MSLKECDVWSLLSTILLLTFDLFFFSFIVEKINKRFRSTKMLITLVSNLYNLTSMNNIFNYLTQDTHYNIQVDASIQKLVSEIQFVS